MSWGLGTLGAELGFEILGWTRYGWGRGTGVTGLEGCCDGFVKGRMVVDAAAVLVVMAAVEGR